MENHIENRDKKLKIVTLIFNLFLWVLLPFSVIFAFVSIFAADAGFTTQLHKFLLTTGMTIAFFSPLIILVCAIASLVLRIIKQYILSLIFEIAPIALILISIAFFVLGGYVNGN